MKLSRTAGNDCKHLFEADGALTILPGGLKSVMILEIAGSTRYPSSFLSNDGERDHFSRQREFGSRWVNRLMHEFRGKSSTGP
jgi:hypothetical protein